MPSVGGGFRHRSEMRGQPMVKFKQRLFDTVIDIFNERHPEKDAEIIWCTGMYVECGAWGETLFPDDGSIPIISIDAEIPVSGAIEIIAHELSHVAVGPGQSHDDIW